MAASPEPQLEITTDTSVNKAINFFWLGFIIYSLSYTISTSDSVNYSFCQALQILGLFLIFPSASILIKWKFDSYYLKVVFTLYICWLITVIIRGIKFDYQSLKHMLFDSTFGIFIYFTPLILLFPRTIGYYKKAFIVIVVLSIAYLLYDLIFIKELLFLGRNIKSQAMLEYFSQHLSLASGFILVTYIYHTKKIRLLALVVIVLTFLLAAIRARRSLMFMSLNILVFAYFIYYYTRKVKIIVFVFSFILIAAVYFIGAKIYSSNRSGLFNYVTERIDENTRVGVEQYFFRDMKPADWIAGRGINGEYYCPLIIEGTFTPYRGVIETGYLQNILHGGIISIGLLLLIAIPAVFKGIFNSNNLLSKAAGIWIFLFLIDLYPVTPTIFSMNYLLVWMSIGICYSKRIRDIPESNILEMMSGK
jgi:hypothetical protein